MKDVKPQILSAVSALNGNRGRACFTMSWMDDLHVGYELTSDSGISKVDSRSLWRYFPRQITPDEAHQLYMQWFFEWFIPWFEWLKSQQFRQSFCR